MVPLGGGRGDRALRRELASFRADARRKLRRALAGMLVGSFLITGSISLGPHLASVARGEVDLWGEPVFDPPYEVGDAEIASIDMDRVHGRSLPDWVMSLDGIDIEREEASFHALRSDVSADRNLTHLLDELRSVARDQPLDGARRMDWLLWAWNDYLEQRAQPYRVEAALHVRSSGPPRLTTRSYRVLSDLENPDGLRLRLLARLDRTNLVEGFLGHASRPRDGALLVLDRILHFATHRLWPMMHLGLDERLDPTQRAFALALRADAERVLPPEHHALLRETAVDQLALLEVAQSIHARHECGSTFQVWGLPFNGLPPSDQMALRDALVRSEDSECPEVTIDEAARMIGASERLGTIEGLEEAVESLILWVARAVAAHELRHVADAGDEPCPGCAPETPAAVRGELRGYLASLTSHDLAALALMQFCDEPATGGTHADVLDLLDDHVLDPDCAHGPPPNLVQRAERAADELLGERADVRLPSDFPSALAILPRRRPGRAQARSGG